LLNPENGFKTYADSNWERDKVLNYFVLKKKPAINYESRLFPEHKSVLIFKSIIKWFFQDIP
jgi:hypothetical protein